MTISNRAGAMSAVMVIAAVMATRGLDADAAITAALKLVLAAAAVGVVPGALVVLAWRPRPRLTILEVLAFGVAVSFALLELLTVAAVSFHFGPLVSLALLLTAAVGVAAAAGRHRSADAIVIGVDELILLALLCVIGGSLYAVGSPVSWWEDQVHVAVARRLSALDAPRLDNLYFAPDIVYTYPFPGIHYFVALVARLGDVDPLFAYQKLRFFWGPAALALLHLMARMVFGAGALGTAVGVTAALLVCNGAFAMVPGFSSGWGQLVPFSHASDVAMTVLLPALLAVAFGYVVAVTDRERWFFLATTTVLTMTLAIVHTREMVQFAVYAGCFLMATLAFGGLRTYARRAGTLVVLVLVIVPAYAAWQARVAGHVGAVVEEERRELVETVQEQPMLELVRGHASTVFERFIPNAHLTFGGLMPLGIMAAPALMLIFHRRPLMYLAVPSIAVYLAVMSVPLLAFGYIYLTYFEILYTPVRNVAPFAYLFIGALVYAVVAGLARGNRPRLVLVAAGLVAGAIGVLAGVSLNQSPGGFFLPMMAACAVSLFAATDATAGVGGKRRAVAAAIAVIGGIALWPEREPVTPSVGVGVEWASGLSELQRAALEETFHLTQGVRESGERESWRYQITDLSSTNIRALVTHPQVAETEDIDRNAYAVRAEPPADVEDQFLGARLVSALMYPGRWMLVGTALVSWGIVFLVPLWLATASGRAAAETIEDAMHAPFYTRALPYALFMIPLVVMTARPAYSPVLAGRTPEAAPTPSTALAALPCLNLGRRPPPFAGDFEGSPQELPPATVCLPSAALIDWARDHLPVEAILAVNRWNPTFVPLVLPQQVLVFPSVDGTLAEERALFARYYGFYAERLRVRGVQPFFNAVETTAERTAFVESLGVTHVLVDPLSLDEMEPVLDSLPDLYTRVFADEGWAIYEVRSTV